MFPVGNIAWVAEIPKCFVPPTKSESVELVAQVSLAARGLDVDRGGAVGATGRAPHTAGGGAVDGAGAATIEIYRKGTQLDRIGGIFIIFQRPLLDGSINQTEVVDAGAFSRVFAGFDKVGNGNAGQKADNGHHNHDFDERERCLSRETNFHTNICLVPYVNPAPSKKLRSGHDFYPLQRPIIAAIRRQ